MIFFMRHFRVCPNVFGSLGLFLSVNKRVVFTVSIFLLCSFQGTVLRVCVLSKLINANLLDVRPG